MKKRQRVEDGEASLVRNGSRIIGMSNDQTVVQDILVGVRAQLNGARTAAAMQNDAGLVNLVVVTLLIWKGAKFDAGSGDTVD